MIDKIPTCILCYTQLPYKDYHFMCVVNNMCTSKEEVLISKNICEECYEKYKTNHLSKFNSNVTGCVPCNKQKGKEDHFNFGMGRKGIIKITYRICSQCKIIHLNYLSTHTVNRLMQKGGKLVSKFINP